MLGTHTDLFACPSQKSYSKTIVLRVVTFSAGLLAGAAVQGMLEEISKEAHFLSVLVRYHIVIECIDMG